MGRHDQARILELSAPNAEVIALAHKIDEAVVELELHLHLRMLDQESRQSGCQMQIAEGDGGGDPQPAAQLRARLLGAGLGLLGLQQHTARPLVELAADIGQRQAPGRPIDQPGAQAILELAQAAADQGFRQAEIASGGAEAAALDDAGEERHIFQPSGHGYCPVLCNSHVQESHIMI